MKSLNLSKLKKVSSDDKCTVFQHPDGHSIRIAHNALQPKMREELKNLPVQKASGGMVKKYAEGTPDEPVLQEEGADQQQSAPVVINVGAQPQQSAQSQVPATQPMPQQPPMQAVAPTPIQDQSPIESIPTPEAESAPAPQDRAPAAEEAERAPVHEYEAEDHPLEQGIPDGAAELQQVQPQQRRPETYQEHYKMALQDYSAQDKAFENDLNNGHITPQTYGDLFAKKSTLGKIGMIFGMMASGAGSGLSGQPNAMLTMMNNEIQNDLEAQKQSKANAQNLIKLNQQHLMNEAQVGMTGAQTNLSQAEANTKAINMANMQMNRMALDKMTDDMEKLPVGSPQRAQAQQALALMYNAVNNENFNIASRAAAASAYYKMMLGSGSSGASNEEAFQQRTNGMRIMGPQGEMIARNLEDKHFPGLRGQASIPLTSADREGLNGGITFDQKLHRFIDWTKKHSGDLSPKDRNTGQAMAAELQGAYRQATHGGVYKEGEQNFISKIIDEHPTKFFNSVRVLPQLNAVAEENRSRIDQLAKSKGFHGYDSPVSPASNQSEVRTMNGVKYQKVSGGWQKVK